MKIANGKKGIFSFLSHNMNKKIQLERYSIESADNQ